MSAVQKDMLPPSYNPEKDSCQHVLSTNNNNKKKNPPVFFSQLFIKCLQKPDSESASLSNFCFYQCKCSQICYWRAVQEQLGCWHSSYSFFKGFCSEYKEADSEIIHGLKVKHILNYFAALKPKAFALKQNHTKAAFPNKHAQMSATG